MKVFTNEDVARASYDTKEHFFLNGMCPYSGSEGRLCGNWCALFYFDQGSEGSNTNPFVILGCKAGEKYLYVERLVEEV